MKKIVKKIGSLLFCCLPLLLALGIQILICIPTMFYYVVIKAVTDTSGDAFALMAKITNGMLSADFQAPLSLAWGLISGGAALFWYLKLRKKEQRIPAKQVFNPLILVGVLFLTFGMYLSISYACVGLEYIRPDWFTVYNELMSSTSTGGVIATIIFVIYIVIIGPIHEELIFRGVTLHYANKAFPFWLANLIQSAYFGLMHMNLVQGIYAFLAGLFMGYVCKEGKSLLPSIALHIAFNFVGTFIMLKPFADHVGMNFVICGIGALIALFAMIVYRAGVRNRDIELNIH